MTLHGTIVIGLPVYNEEAALPKLLVRLDGLRERFGDSLHLCFVDDGSTDRTAALLAEYIGSAPNARRLAHPANRGLGAAMRTMLEHVSTHYGDKDILVTLDADNTHSPELIPDMVRKLRDERLDLVVASRFAPGGEERGVPWLRKAYSRGAKAFFKLLFPIAGVTDYSSGFRAYSVGALRRAFREYGGIVVTSTGFACMAELIARLGKIGVNAGEVPLRLEYGLKEGRSKMNALRTIAGYIRLLRVVKHPSPASEPEFPAFDGAKR
ncbi:glycosyltransferase family 2 protein [Paenibacillus sp. GYB003]|uniref:glycosyltransferase family 2 protein n=1 Tax=Paenibacillus sp. GYB003 TaxID=2994392 RepID=UPI002F96E815